MPDRRRFGWLVAAYALIVAIATIYGRYHFATDALAGLGVSLLAFTAIWMHRLKREPV
jgi:membrane-associated phospholipid phosphatase